MTQSTNVRRAQIARSRANNHQKQLESKKRLDEYVLPETKEAIKEIKARFGHVKNQGQALDVALKLALLYLKEHPEQIESPVPHK